MSLGLFQLGLLQEGQYISWSLSTTKILIMAILDLQCNPKPIYSEQSLVRVFRVASFCCGGTSVSKAILLFIYYTLWIYIALKFGCNPSWVSDKLEKRAVCASASLQSKGSLFCPKPSHFYRGI